MKILSIVLLLSSFFTVYADEIVLVDGRTLTGTILSDPGADTVRIRVSTGSMSMTMTLKRSRILRLSYGQSREEKDLANFQTQKNALAANDSTGLWTLALDIKKLKKKALFHQYAREVIAIDPQHHAAHTALRHVLHEGVWMSKADKHRALGNTFFEGRWINAETLAATVAQRESVRLARLERREQREKERRIRQRESQQFLDIKYRSPYPYSYSDRQSCYDHSHNAHHQRNRRRSFSASGTHRWGNWSFTF